MQTHPILDMRFRFVSKDSGVDSLHVINPSLTGVRRFDPCPPLGGIHFRGGVAQLEERLARIRLKRIENYMHKHDAA